MYICWYSCFKLSYSWCDQPRWLRLTGSILYRPIFESMISRFFQHKANATLVPVCVWWDFNVGWVQVKVCITFPHAVILTAWGFYLILAQKLSRQFSQVLGPSPSHMFESHYEGEVKKNRTKFEWSLFPCFLMPCKRKSRKKPQSQVWDEAANHAKMCWCVTGCIRSDIFFFNIAIFSTNFHLR